MKKIALALIRLYQAALSPFMGQQCRFYPTCSHYTAEAIEHFGIVRGVLKGAGRILRCHPYTRGGYDPVLKKEVSHENTA